MTKQAKKAIVEAQNQQNQFKAQELDLQLRFSKMSIEKRQAVGNYLNAYNLAAWLYNEILDEDCREYIDIAMKYTLETQELANSMRDLDTFEINPDASDHFVPVDKIVNDINYGE